MRAKNPQSKGGAIRVPADGTDEPVSCVYLEKDEVFVITLPLFETRYPEGVTAAEREVIDLLLGGATPREIALLRGSSVRTVTTQLAEIYRKAGVQSARQLAAFATGVDGP